VFSHEHNTFDKRKLLENPHPDLVKQTDKEVKEFIKDDEMRNFYMNEIDILLKDYEPGRPTMKPDVLTQIIEIEERRRKDAENRFQELAAKMGGKIVIQNKDGTSKELSNDDIIKLLREQQTNINSLVGEIKQRDEIIGNLKSQSLLHHTSRDNISLNIIEHDEKKLMAQINQIN
jgi:hypothetical protein